MKKELIDLLKTKPTYQALYYFFILKKKKKFIFYLIFIFFYLDFKGKSTSKKYFKNIEEILQEKTQKQGVQ